MINNTGYEVVVDDFNQFVDIGNKPERLCTGFKWTEGPVYIYEKGTLLFSDIPNNCIMQWQRGKGESYYLRPSNFSNGNTLDKDGLLITCEHGGRRVVRHHPNGKVEILADSFEGKKFNSPNDLVISRDGAIWFTDPPYGILSNVEGYKAKSELDRNYVFRLDPHSKSIDIVADDFDKPNGLAFSPDEKKLYIADSGAINGASDPSFNRDAPHHIRCFDVLNGRIIRNSTIFVDINQGVPDGIRVDSEGFVWSSASDGVHCYSPTGVLYGKILIPEVVANLTFGGHNGKYLFIAASTSIYGVKTNRQDAKKARHL
ncbi:MAG: SMP-30/gluconolactonase/LRE family protein [Alphaproteobacteria bacterium]|nr:SMP-30/gluconolactonase/LRE family protein [Alphaproteobacteria bacterium]